MADLTWNVYLVNPDQFHNNWGSAISLIPHHEHRQKYNLVGQVTLPETIDWDTACFSVTRKLMDFDKTAFHQGGFHLAHETCGQWHYVEYFGMSDSTERGLDLLEYLERLVLDLGGKLRVAS